MIQNIVKLNLTNVNEVPANVLIEALANKLKTEDTVKPPEWSSYVKTGSHAERPPQNDEWWYERCASILRKVYVHGPVGLTDLQEMYGGKKKIKFSKNHQRDAGQSAIRKPLQQLEVTGYVKKKKSEGRIITGKGMSLIDKTSAVILKELSENNPELKKYL